MRAESTVLKTVGETEVPERKSAILIISVLMGIMLEKKMFRCPCAHVCPTLPHRASRSYQDDVRDLLRVSL